MPVNFNIADLFYEACTRNPARIALIDGKKQVTYAELEQEINLTVNHLMDRGIRKGDRILVAVPMGIDLYRNVLALFRIGAVAVFLDEWVSFERLNTCCNIANCTGLIGTSKVRLLAILSSGLRKIPVHLGTKINRGATKRKVAQTSPDDIALLTFTTGSTGTPKAAIRTHGLLKEQFKALVNIIHPRENDISMPVLPIVLLINLGLGITSIITRFKSGKVSALDPKKVVGDIHAKDVNTIIASPYFIKELARYLNQKGLSLPSLRTILTGGAPVFPEEAQIYSSAFPKSSITIVYGSTEAEPISSISVPTLLAPEKQDTQGLCVGKVDENANVKIISITDEPIVWDSPDVLNKLEMPTGEIGEIIVSGPHVLRSYLNDANNLAHLHNKIMVGDSCWHRTGDSGYMDSRGNLFLTGRCNTLIYVGDEVLSPFMYERNFKKIPGVEVGTILPIPPCVTAVIELSDRHQKDTVKTTIQALSSHIGNVIFVRSIPRDPRHHSKIDYEQLHAKLTQKAVTWKR
jgi:acyl-CoA synthetase (AMP-forming)/AMP-acid ligase II